MILFLGGVLRRLFFFHAGALVFFLDARVEPADMVRDHVAGVFYNRLASDRPYLESDATTAYEVGREPTAEEVHAETPYSTYANAGLPPTPICSPGLESLTAVCEPTQTEDMFFYFYPDADGNMQAAFSKTYEEHQQAIADNSNAGGADGSGDAAAGEGAAA